MLTERDIPLHGINLADARATLLRDQLLGHDPTVVLRAVAAAVDPRRALKPGQDVEWPLRDYLSDHPDPQLADPTSRTGRTTAWQTIAWTLKAHETAGHDPAELLPDGAEIRAEAENLTGGRARFERMHRLANTHLYVQEIARQMRETARLDGALRSKAVGAQAFPRRTGHRRAHVREPRVRRDQVDRQARRATPMGVARSWDTPEPSPHGTIATCPVPARECVTRTRRRPIP